MLFEGIFCSYFILLNLIGGYDFVLNMDFKNELFVFFYDLSKYLVNCSDNLGNLNYFYYVNSLN